MMQSECRCKTGWKRGRRSISVGRDVSITENIVFWPVFRRGFISYGMEKWSYIFCNTSATPRSNNLFKKNLCRRFASSKNLRTTLCSNVALQINYVRVQIKLTEFKIEQKSFIRELEQSAFINIHYQDQISNSNSIRESQLRI